MKNTPDLNRNKYTNIAPAFLESEVINSEKDASDKLSNFRKKSDSLFETIKIIHKTLELIQILIEVFFG